MYKNALGVIYFATVICSLQAELLEGLYCGKENCYEVLGVARDSSKNEIARSYRRLAKKYHPDLQRDINAKKEAEEQFKIVATAYEILKDDESRVDYDYMLDNPDAYYAHYYRYYRRRVAPKVDVRIVIFVTISIISIIQYYSAWQRYNTAIKYFMNVPKYRNRALDIAKQDGLVHPEKKSRKSKTEQKDELDRIIQKVIEDKMDIKGAYAKPSLFDVLWVQLLIFPYTLAKYIYWYMSWFWRHTILQQPYDEEEKLYLIRKYLKLGKHQFDSLEDEKKDEYLRKELWMREKFEAWRKEEEESMKKQLADSAKFKQYRRYIKNHGIGRMTFDDS